jgi:tRNA (cmo5U34)-methyltransferase
MIARSVPFYDETRSTSLGLAQQFFQSDSNIYDLGCSTATLLVELARLVDDPSVSLIGIDNSAPMIAEAQEKLAATGLTDRVTLEVADLEGELALENASAVFLHYTLQFIHPLQRTALLSRIHDGMNRNGCLIVIEKVRGRNSTFDRLYVDLYYAYKQRMGYSDEEIRQKREALDNVLIPYRLDENMSLIERAGFSDVDVFFKWYNFAGIIAVKA